MARCGVSPLLDFVQKLSENGASEVVGQTVSHVVFDEGFDHRLDGREVGFIYPIITAA